MPIPTPRPLHRLPPAAGKPAGISTAEDQLTVKQVRDDVARRQKFLAALEARIKPATTAFKTADAEVEAAQTDIDGRTAAVEPFQAVMAPYLAEKFRRAREDIKSYVKDTEVLQAGTKTIVISDYKPQPIQHPQMDPHLTYVPPAQVGAAQSSIAVAKTAAMAAKSVVKFERTLRNGDEGDEVKLVQQALDNAGHAINIDGKFGAGAEQAVRAFQIKSGLDEDGEVGKVTRAKLGL